MKKDLEDLLKVYLFVWKIVGLHRSWSPTQCTQRHSEHSCTHCDACTHNYIAVPTTSHESLNSMKANCCRMIAVLQAGKVMVSCKALRLIVQRRGVGDKK